MGRLVPCLNEGFDVFEIEILRRYPMRSQQLSSRIRNQRIVKIKDDCKRREW